MTEHEALSPPEEAPPEPPPVPAAQARQQRNLVPWIYGLGFVVLALALLWIWQNPLRSPQTQPDLTPIERQLASLQRHVMVLTQRPAPQPVDLAPLRERIAALEHRPAPAPPDLALLDQQVAALKAQLAAMPKAAPDLGPLTQRVGALESAVAEQRNLAAQEAGLAARVTQLAAAQQTLAQQVDSAAAVAGKAARLARITEARLALEAGEPLGTIPDAPPALARFAQAKPPTEAQLRLRFPNAAKAALKAGQPDTADKPFGERLMQRAQELITVREGSHVIVGNPAAGTIAEAENRLDAGDLGGAVSLLSSLSGPPAESVAGWLDQAKAVLAARAALAAMATQR